MSNIERARVLMSKPTSIDKDGFWTFICDDWWKGWIFICDDCCNGYLPVNLEAYNPLRHRPDKHTEQREE